MLRLILIDLLVIDILSALAQCRCVFYLAFCHESAEYIIVHDIVIFVGYLFAVYVKFGDSCLTVRRSAEDHLILFTVSGSACKSDLVGAEVEPPFGLLEIVVESLTVTLAFQLDVFIQLEIVV